MIYSCAEIGGHSFSTHGAEIFINRQKDGRSIAHTGMLSTHPEDLGIDEKLIPLNLSI